MTTKPTITIERRGHRVFVEVAGRPALTRAFFGDAAARRAAEQYAAELTAEVVERHP